MARLGGAKVTTSGSSGANIGGGGLSTSARAFKTAFSETSPAGLATSSAGAFAGGGKMGCTLRAWRNLLELAGTAVGAAGGTTGCAVFG